MGGKKSEKTKQNKRKDSSYINQAILPSAAFIAVPRAALVPPFELQSVLRPVGLSGLSTVKSSQAAATYSDDEAGENSYVDYPSEFPTEHFSGSRPVANQNSSTLGPPIGFADSDAGSAQDDLLDMLDAIGTTTMHRPQELAGDYEIMSGTRRTANRKQSSPAAAKRRSKSMEDTARKRYTGRGRRQQNTQQPIPSTSVDQEYETVVQSVPYLAESAPYNATFTVEADVHSTMASQSLEFEQKQCEEAANKQRESEIVLQQFNDTIRSKVKQRLSDALSQPNGKSSQELATLLQDSQSVIDQTQHVNDSYRQTMENRIECLETLKQQLMNTIQQQKYEIETLKQKMLQQQQTRQPVVMSNNDLARQVQDLRNEAATLNSVIHELNQQLSRYQAKCGVLTETELEELPGIPRNAPVPIWLIDTKILAPLLVAYKDQLKQKNEAILQYQVELDHCTKKFDEIIKENTRLHIKLEQVDATGQPVAITEWKQLQEQCKLVLEENELLMEQLDIQEKKYSEQRKSDVVDIMKLTERASMSDLNCQQLDQQLDELREKHLTLRRQFEQVLNELTGKMDIDEHINAVSALKRSHQEEKESIKGELAEVSSQLRKVEMERDSLTKEVSKLSEVIKQFEVEIKQRNKNERKYQKYVELLQSVMDKMQMKELTVEQYLNSVLKTAAQTAIERDGLVQSMETVDKDKMKAWKKLIAESASKSRMKEKMKEIRQKAECKVEEIADRLKEKEAEMARMKQDYEDEMTRQRQIIRSSEDRLSLMENEKRDLLEDLESLWQSASRHNQQMLQSV